MNYEKSGIFERYQNYTLKQIKKSEKFEQVLSLVKEFKPFTVVISSKERTVGKTILVNILLKHYLDNGYPVKYATHDGIMRAYKETWNDSDKSITLTAALKSPYLLGIDNLGVNKTGWNYLKSILEYRFNRMLGTIIVPMFTRIEMEALEGYTDLMKRIINCKELELVQGDIIYKK